ncbi:MAG: branched-chain amino acid transaminase [Chloroflexi bacterium]|nr:branched-chain amino acid transaminase [Chloroflexota bacterium]
MAIYAFFKGKIVPVAEAKISVMTHAFNYGTAVFEGIRAYWNDQEKQLYVFKLPEHFARLHRSARIMRITLRYSVPELCDFTLEVLRRSEFHQDVYIRPIAYKASELVGVRLHNLEDDFTLFAMPFGKYVEKDEARCCVSSWRRIDDNAIPPRAKITGSYVNSAICKTEAVENGFDEAIVLNPNGNVSEGSAENIFIVRDGTLVTPRVTENILEGITRQLMMQLGTEELGVQVEERAIDRTELYVADECFLCGTGGEIVPVVEIDHRPVGSGHTGPITKQLHKLYFDIVRGVNKKYIAWCTPVYV